MSDGSSKDDWPAIDCCIPYAAMQALERQWEAQSVDFASYWLMKRLFFQWRHTHSVQAAATAQKLTAAVALAFQNTSSMVLMRWQQWVELQHERRRRLQAAFMSVMEADESISLRVCFERWQSYRRQGQLFSAKSDVALQLSQKRMLQVSTSENAHAGKSHKVDTHQCLDPG